jgi:DNA-binding transcriptional MerR regulator
MCIVRPVPADVGAVRIGEFARRVGVSAELLRAWERRYGLLRPVRSAGGFRLYTDEDADRVRRMRQSLAEGMSAAEAAQAAMTSERPAENLLDDAADRLFAAVSTFDEAGVHAVLDEHLAAFGVEVVLRELIFPVLRRIGEAWERAELGVSHEHFASNLIRGRLLALARLWGRGGGPLALLACPPGEEHDLSLLAFGLVLRSHGWRILFLGADTPIETLRSTAEQTQPNLAVLTTFDPLRLSRQAAPLRELADQVTLAISGPGATEKLAGQVGARLLDADPVTAAGAVGREAA